MADGGRERAPSYDTDGCEERVCSRLQQVWAMKLTVREVRAEPAGEGDTRQGPLETMQKNSGIYS